MKFKLRISIIALLCSIFAIAGCRPVPPRTIDPQSLNEPPLEIAVMLPATSTRLIQLITAGLKDSVADDQKIHITNYNVSNQDNAKAAIAKACDRQTKIIIGPLFADLTRLITAEAKLNNIPVISLSNNPSIIAENVYTFGHFPLKATKFLTTHLLNEDYTHFILLLPNNLYSSKFIEVIEALASSYQNSSVKVIHYENQAASIENSILQVSTLVDQLNESPHILTKPLIYLADGQEQLVKLFDKLTKYHLDQKALIYGDHSLNIDYPKNINLMFTGSMNYLQSPIPVKMKEMLGTSHLSILEKLAYDAGLVVGHAIGQPFNYTEFKQRLDNSQGFITISGTLKFTNHIADREYDIIVREGRDYHQLHSNLAAQAPSE